jgi:hypothetical protein
VVKAMKNSVAAMLSKEMDIYLELVEMVLDSVCTEMENNPGYDEMELELKITDITRQSLRMLKDSKPVTTAPIFKDLLAGGTIGREKAIKALFHNEAYARIFKAHLPIENKMVAIYLLG